MNFKLIAASAVLLHCLCAFAQEVEYPYDRQLKKGNYEKAERKINETLQKEPECSIYYAAYVLHSKKDYSGYNPVKAYDYLVASVNDYDNNVTVNEKNRIKLEKHGFSNNLFLEQLTLVGKLGLEQAVAVNTIDAYNEFLSHFTRVSAESRTEAENRRNAIAYENAQREGTEDAYNNFLQKYPLSLERDRAVSARNAVAYSNAEKKGTLDAYENFINKYPAASQAERAWNHVYRLAYEEAQKKNNEYTYRFYASKYPYSPFSETATKIADQMEYDRLVIPGDWESYKAYISKNPNKKTQVEAAKLAIFNIGKKLHTIEALDYGVSEFGYPLKDSCLLVLHDIYAESGLIYWGKFFSDYNINYTSCQKLQDLKEKYNSINSWSSDDELIRAAAPYMTGFVKLYMLVEEDLKARRWANALKVVKKYQNDFKGNNYYKNLLTVLEAPADPSIKVFNIGGNINTRTGSEYAPAISADDKYLYFCGINRSDSKGGEDIFFSKKTGGVWSKAKLVPDLNTSYLNEAPLALSADGTRLLMFTSGDLAISNKTKTGWSYPEKLPSNINICEWQADAMIASNGKAMLFAARKKVPYEFEESKNIYVSIMDENGEWGVPIDLGPTINTPFDDRSPILHPDMKTLYFCSQGHGSLGGLDVFKSTRLNDDSWTEWSEPVSLGKEINSIENECWYKISTDGKKAYFSKTLEGEQQDILWLNLPVKMRPNPVATVSGKLVDNEGNSIVTNIKWEDLNEHKVVGESKTDPEDGSYFITLPMGRNYGYYVDDEDYFPLSDNLDLTKKNENIVVENDLKVASVDQMVKDSVAMPMNNLFFNVDDSTLLKTSISELKRVAKLIKRVNRRVEISGHTDDTGGDEYNQKLSEGRAAAAKRYLVEQGVDEGMLISVGYGKRKPVATNKTVKGRKLNRRVEMRFIQ